MSVRFESASQNIVEDRRPVTQRVARGGRSDHRGGLFSGRELDVALEAQEKFATRGTPSPGTRRVRYPAMSSLRVSLRSERLFSAYSAGLPGRSR